MEHGVDPLYGYRYLKWRLGSPHRPKKVKRMIKRKRLSPRVVFTVLFDYMADWLGTGFDNDDNDLTTEHIIRILRYGKSWGQWPKSDRVGDWTPRREIKDLIYESSEEEDSSLEEEEESSEKEFA